MSYQARRGEGNEQIDASSQKQRNIQNNADNVRNAADVAIATKNPYAAAAGATVKAADKLTGGKSSEAIGDSLDKILNRTRSGQQLQNKLNELNESGLSDKLGKAAAASNGMASSNASTNKDAMTDNSNATDENEKKIGRGSSLSNFFNSEDRKREQKKGAEGNDSEQDYETEVEFRTVKVVEKVAIIFAPALLFILFFVIIISSVVDGVGEMDDALGSNTKIDGPTGGVIYEPTTKEAEKFYDRLEEVRLEYLEDEKDVDIVKISAVYKIMNNNKTNYDYDYMTKKRIRIIADAMFNEDGLYDEELFKERLINEIFLQLFPLYTKKGRERLTEEVFEYIENYYGLVGEGLYGCTSGSTNCNSSASTGPYASWKQYSGPWTTTQIGNSGKNIRQVGCLATSVAILIAKSNVPTKVENFNPGTFVEYLSKNGGFSGANFNWASTSKIAPSFQSQNLYNISGYSQQQKFNKINELLNDGCYLVAEVMGNTGQHWVAIDGISGSTILMMDPGSSNTNMWDEYYWGNTSRLGCYKVVR